MKNYLEKAIEIVGSQLGLARELKKKTGRPVSQGSVWGWLNESKHGVPAEYCIPIEQITGGKVRREQLRPDVYQGTRA